MSWCDCDLIFNLSVVRITCKFLSRSYQEDCKVKEVDAWLDNS